MSEVPATANVESLESTECETLVAAEFSRDNVRANLMIAAGFAFDKVISVELATIVGAPKTRFCLSMLHSLAMGMLQEVFDAEPTRRFSASDVTNLVFEELAKHNVVLN